MLAATTITALHVYINNNNTTKFSPSRSNTTSSSRVLVKYSRGKPLETTLAAYHHQLINQEQDKAVAWDDDELEEDNKRRNSSTRNNRGWEKGGEAQPASTAASQGFQPKTGGNFSRLGTQKVSSLIRKVSRIKKEIAKEDNYNRRSGGGSARGGGGQDKYRSTSRVVSQPEEEIRDRRRFQQDYDDDDDNDNDNEAMEEVSSHDHSQSNTKHATAAGNKKLVGGNIDTSTPVNDRYERNAYVARSGAGSSLRGWGTTPPSQNSKFDLTAYSKQKRVQYVDSGFFSRKSFKDLGCTDDMVEALKGQLFTRPSHIQAMAFAPAIEGKTCIIADQSGSGKTLAYLSPVIQRLRQEELQGLGRSSSGSPSVVILAPTAELASQILGNCRSISKLGVPFRSMVATGGFKQKTQLESLQQDLDVLIATPGRFMFLLNEGFLQLTNLKCAVLDEVDILFGDEDFQNVLQSFVKSAPVSTQYIFVTATLPVEVYNKVVEVFPDSEVIMGPGMHRTSSKLEEVLVDCSGDDGSEKTPETAFLNKKSALLEILERTPVPKTIVFCNKIETCRKVENLLNRFDRKGLHIQVLPFHSAVAQESRFTNLKSFNNSQSNNESLFLICTDRASRGIDFAGVDHVVLFDFPREPSEYVRRVGRTARGAGGKGKAFVFVVGKQVSLAQRIMERNLKGHPLHDIPTAY